VDVARFDAISANKEAGMYAQRPSYFLSYLVGFHKIRELRRRLEEKEGAAGRGLSMRNFHDVMLDVGTIPFTLVEELLL
jgi:uncharacterized protein (DUF885 family)